MLKASVSSQLGISLFGPLPPKLSLSCHGPTYHYQSPPKRVTELEWEEAHCPTHASKKNKMQNGPLCWAFSVNLIGRTPFYCKSILVSFGGPAPKKETGGCSCFGKGLFFPHVHELRIDFHHFCLQRCVGSTQPSPVRVYI